MKIGLRLEEASDFQKVENLTREVFWDVYRPGCFEHLVLHQLRKSPAFVRDLSILACDGDEIVGNIVYSRANVAGDDGQRFEVLCAGPLGVLQAYQGKGIGSLLMKHTIELARVLGFRGIVLYGKPEYYQRFGFVDAGAYGIQTATGDNFPEFMALELTAGALGGIRGKFQEDAAFQIDEGELERFEQGFPFKEKHVTPTQIF